MSTHRVFVRTRELGAFEGTLHAPRLATLPRTTPHGAIELMRVDIPWLVLGNDVVARDEYYMQRYVAFVDDPRDGEWHARKILSANSHRSNYVCLGKNLLADTSFWNTPFTCDARLSLFIDSDYAAHITHVDGNELWPPPRNTPYHLRKTAP